MDRWFWVGEHLQADLAAVFLGIRAAKAVEFPWPEECVHHAPERNGSDGSVLSETTKIYIPYAYNATDKDASVYLTELSCLCNTFELSPSWYEWQFRRADARVVCCRASEVERFKRGEIPSWVFGFGRPNPINPNFKVHPDFAGPLRDYRPETPDIPETWKGFEPVFMKVEPGSGFKIPYYIKIHPQWGDEEVALIVEENPVDMPEVLKLYEFGKKSNKKKVQTRF